MKKLKLLLTAAVFAAGLGASYALADDGHGKSGQAEGTKCREVHVRGTVGPQTFTVTLDRGSKRLNLAAGSQVVVTMGGGTGQIVRLNAEACSATTGSTTSLQAKKAELHVRNAPTTTAPATTTQP